MIRIEHQDCAGHWHWTCPDCHTTGQSTSKHQARVNLYAHWRRTHRDAPILDAHSARPGGANPGPDSPQPAGFSG